MNSKKMSDRLDVIASLIIIRNWCVCPQIRLQLQGQCLNPVATVILHIATS